MTTYEKFGGTGIERLPNRRIISARITAYVSHQHISTLAIPPELLRIEPTQLTTITIAEDSTQRTELL